MFEEFVERHCKSLPGARLAEPFGPDMYVWTVAEKMFAAYTKGSTGVSIRARSAQEAQKMIQQGKAVSAPYLKSGGWVMVEWRNTSPHELRRYITQSYAQVRAELNPNQQASLPPFDAGQFKG